MYRWKNELSALKIQFVYEWCSPQVLAGFILGGGYSFSLAMRYMMFASGLGVHFLEPFVLVTNFWSDLSFLMLGYFLVMVKAPFVHNLTTMIMVRLQGRKSWLRSIGACVVIQTILYWGWVILCSALPCFFTNWLGGNEWSETLYILLHIRPGRSVEVYNLPSFNETLMDLWSPWQAAGFCLLLVVGYSLLVVAIMFTLNLLSTTPLGSVGALFLHLVGIILIKISFLHVPRLSYLANAMLTYHTGQEMGLTYGIVFIYISVIGMVILLVKVSMRCDYRVANSEKF